MGCWESEAAAHSGHKYSADRPPMAVSGGKGEKATALEGQTDQAGPGQSGTQSLRDPAGGPLPHPTLLSQERSRKGGQSPIVPLLLPVAFTLKVDQGRFCLGSWAASRIFHTEGSSGVCRGGVPLLGTLGRPTQAPAEEALMAPCCPPSCMPLVAALGHGHAPQEPQTKGNCPPFVKWADYLSQTQPPSLSPLHPAPAPGPQPTPQPQPQSKSTHPPSSVPQGFSGTESPSTQG